MAKCFASLRRGLFSETFVRFSFFSALFFFVTLTFAQNAAVPPVDENLVLFLSDVHVAPEPLVRWALPVETEKGKTIDYQYEKRGVSGEYLVETDTQANLRKLVTNVLSMNPRPSCVINLGDDVQVPGMEAYAQMREILRPLEDAGIRYVKIMGNHDHPVVSEPNTDYLKVFPETQAQSISPSPNWQAFRVPLPEVDLVIFETFDPLRNGWQDWFSSEQKAKYAKNDTYLRYYGAFLPEQQRWLHDVLASQPSDRPLFLCGHHLVDFDAFLPEYRDFPQLQGWIHGHFHKFYLPKELGIRALSLPSACTLGVGTFQTPPACVKMEVLPDGYRFTLRTLDENAPENEKSFLFPKRTGRALPTVQ